MSEPTTLSPVDRQLAAVSDVLDRFLGIILAVIMFFMMVLTFIDVVGRQGFDAPVSGGSELTEIALGYVVYLGLPLVCIRREHITIGLLSGLFKGRVLQVQHVILNLIFTATTFIWARQVWIQGESLQEANSEFMFLQIDIAPFVFTMSAFTYFSAAIFLFLAVCYLRGATPKRSGEEG